MRKFSSLLCGAALAMGALSVVPTTVQAKPLGWQYAGLNMAPNKEGGPAQMLNISQFCGKKKVKIAFSVGFGGNYWRRINRAEFENEAAKCPNITETAYTDGEFRADKQIADIKGLVARGFNVIIVTPDAGAAIFRAIQDATRAGAIVVVNDVGNDFPGKAGRDYLDAVRIDTRGAGVTMGTWMAKALNDKGNVLIFSGTAGNSYSATLNSGIESVLAKHPAMKLLQKPIVANWDPALAQKEMTALLAKYSKIDGIFSETDGPIRAYEAAGRKVPAWSGQELNETSCLWKKLSPTDSKFKIGQLSAHTWTVRIALRKGLAAFEGMSDPEPSIISVPITEDSTSTNPKLAVKCDPSMPPDSIPTSMLPKSVQKKLLSK